MEKRSNNEWYMVQLELATCLMNLSKVNTASKGGNFTKLGG